MRMEAFKEFPDKSENKEFVILKEGRAISAHFPCSLINNNDKPLRIKYANRKKEEGESMANCPSIENQSGKFIVFHLCTRGEKT